MADKKICRYCRKEIKLFREAWIAVEMPRSAFCGMAAQHGRKHEPRD